MTRYRVVFWEPSISPHKLPLFRALSVHPAVAATVYVAQEGLPTGRAAQGWQLGALDDLDVQIAPDGPMIARLFSEPDDDVVSLHLFSGLRRVPVIRQGLSQAISRGARYAIMSEPRVVEGWRGKLRLLQSWLTERQIRRSVAFILAIGRNGPPWFVRAGYRRERIYPFAYFLPLSDGFVTATKPSEIPTIAYIGRLVPEKGILLFLDVIAALAFRCRIVIAGAGPLADHVAAQLAQWPDARYLGVVPMAHVHDLLATVDILVQPSLTTDDGWGAVIGEALMAGAKVVATLAAGASILLDDPDLGMVAAPNPSELAAAIAATIAAGGFDPVSREKRAAWAARSIGGKGGADRLMAIVSHALEAGAPPPPFPPSINSG